MRGCARALTRRAAHALYVFAGGSRDPPAPTAAEIARGAALAFAPGVHRLGDGTGVVQLPPGLRRIFLARGAWVEGRFNVSAGSAGLTVDGHGVISGGRYRYHGGRPEDSMRAIEPAWGVPLRLDGVTIADPKGHAVILPPHSMAQGLKVLGWLFNEDGVWLTSNSTLRDSFIRTNDDSIRLYAGAVDHFDHYPPPPHDGPAVGVLVERVVVQQLFNGAVVQLGWESEGTDGAVVRDITVLGAEWYLPAALSGYNDAVLSLQSPVYDLSMLERHTNLTVAGIRIEAPVGRLVAVALAGAAPTGCSAVAGLLLQNWSTQHPLAWLNTAGDAGPGPTGSNLLLARGCDTISGVAVQGMTIAGRSVASDGDWLLESKGAGVSPVTYIK